MKPWSLTGAFFMALSLFFLLLLMEYLSITNSADDLHFVQELYLSAFPQKERRDWEVLTGMIGAVPEMQLRLILEEEKPIGFITTWELGDWCFIEHFAISPEHRGKKYGKRVMRDFLGHNKVVLEVEPPLAEDAARRVKFYERAGLVCLPFSYLQPPYRQEDAPYRMVLMSNLAEVSETAYQEIVNLIFEKVYDSTRRI